MSSRTGEVVIVGVGQTPVGEHWELSLRTLAARAMLAAIHDANGLKPQSIYIGNMLAITASHQANLGALLAENAGLTGAEGVTVEAADASGGAALRMAYLAVASGYVDVAMAVGVEKVTDVVGVAIDNIAAQMLDADFEATEGLTPVAQAGMLMQRYLYETQAQREAFAGFALTAHANGAGNPNAMYRKAIKPELYHAASMVADPLNLFDVAPYADGAAAVILTRSDLIPAGIAHGLVRVTGSSLVIDRLAAHDRQEPLNWYAAGFSVERACRQAGILPGDVDFFEYADTTALHAALSLEQAGFAERGKGWQMATPEMIGLQGKMPVATMGGFKARGHPLGASGVYQAVEACLQLRGEAGKNQISNARRGLIQCLGGAASTAVAHVLEVYG